MLLGIAGVTGVGKSYYKDKIVNELNFNKVKIITKGIDIIVNLKYYYSMANMYANGICHMQLEN